MGVLDRIMEAVLYLALFAACGALVTFVVLTTTPRGRRWRERLDRRRGIDEEGSHCTVHGTVRDEDMMRLATGERICPHCFRESMRASG